MVCIAFNDLSQGKTRKRAHVLSLNFCLFVAVPQPVWVAFVWATFTTCLGLLSSKFLAQLLLERVPVLV